MVESSSANRPLGVAGEAGSPSCWWDAQARRESRVPRRFFGAPWSTVVFTHLVL